MKSKSNQATIRLDEDTTNLCDYWYQKQGFSSRTAFIKAAIQRYIAFINGDYQLPNAETVRLNQLISSVDSLGEQIKLLRATDEQGFNALLNLTDDTLPTDIESK